MKEQKELIIKFAMERKLFEAFKKLDTDFESLEAFINYCIDYCLYFEFDAFKEEREKREFMEFHKSDIYQELKKRYKTFEDFITNYNKVDNLMETEKKFIKSHYEFDKKNKA